MQTGAMSPPAAFRPRRPHAPSTALAAAVAYAAGSVPVANLAARRSAGVDLRRVGSGTVSGTGLYEVAGFGPLALAGCAELAKGAVGPLIARRDGPVASAACASLAVCGHDWSPLLGFRGGRGLSLLLGALAVIAPEGAALLALALGAGRLARETGAASAAALVALPAVLARRYGRPGWLAGTLLVLPVFSKRLVGDANRLPSTPGSALRRLLFDAEGRGFARGRSSGR